MESPDKADEPAPHVRLGYALAAGYPSRCGDYCIWGLQASGPGWLTAPTSPLSEKGFRMLPVWPGRHGRICRPLPG